MDINLKIGDEILLMDIFEETSVIPGTRGIVTDIISDPFEQGNYIISVNWNNGSTLSLLSNHDKWRVVKKNLKESDDEIIKKIDPQTHFLINNKDLKKAFNLSFFRNYFLKLRDSGIVNMFGSSSLVYQDREHIERYYGEGREDDENFQELLDIQDDARQNFVLGLIKYAKMKNIDLDDDARINSLAKKLAPKLLEFYMLFV
jgi:hypothetical protein